MLRRQRAIEIVPGSKPLRWRRYDVPQHLAPETSDALRFCAVEGDLDLLDRRHRSTIEARPSHRRPGPGSPRGRGRTTKPARNPGNRDHAESTEWLGSAMMGGEGDLYNAW